MTFPRGMVFPLLKPTMGAPRRVGKGVSTEGGRGRLDIGDYGPHSRTGRR